MESAFKIHSMEEYLNFYMEETGGFFKEEFPELKERFLPIASKSNERSRNQSRKLLNSMRESIH